VSRIGKRPISIPKGVDVKIDENKVVIKGKLGELSFSLPELIEVEKSDSALVVKRKNDEKKARAFHGLVQRSLSNIVKGVTEGFKKELEIMGVGYRAAVEGKKLMLSVGYSKPVEFPIPKEVKIETPKPTNIIISGIDKQKVGEIAAEIKRVRPPDAYKGKGIRYLGEYIKKKPGKAGK